MALLPSSRSSTSSHRSFSLPRLLCLPLLLCLLVSVARAEVLYHEDCRQMTGKNSDFFFMAYSYSVTAPATAASFNTSSPCTLLPPSPPPPSPSPSPSPPPLLLLIVWDQALQSGCETLSQAAASAEQMYPEGPWGERVFMFGVPSEGKQLSWGSLSKLPFGEVGGIGTSAYLTVVPLAIPFDSEETKFTVTARADPNELLLTASWKVVQWFFFSVWGIMLLAALAQLLVLLRGSKGLKETVQLPHFVIFASISLSIAFHLVELGVDPSNSYGILSLTAWTFLWWLFYLFAFYAFAGLNFAWFSTMDLYGKSSGFERKLRWLMWAVSGAFTFSCLFFACTEGSSSSGVALVRAALFGFNVLIVLVVVCTFLVLCIKVLSTIRRLPVKPVARKLNAVLFVSVLGFIALIAATLEALPPPLGSRLGFELAMLMMEINIVVLYGEWSHLRCQKSAGALPSYSNLSSKDSVVMEPKPIPPPSAEDPKGHPEPEREGQALA